MAPNKNCDDSPKNELLEAVDEDRRDLVKKILIGGAAVYVAPVIATFSLSAPTAMAQGTAALGSNMATHSLGSNMGMHPLGSNQRY